MILVPLRKARLFSYRYHDRKRIQYSNIFCDTPDQRLGAACQSTAAGGLQPCSRERPRVGIDGGKPARFSKFDERLYVPDRIVIPSIELDTPVVDQGWNATTGSVFGNWDVASFATGWHVNSDLLGQGVNVVFSAHNNMLGAVFRELDQLKAGDVATIWSGSRRFDYEIDSVVIVPERDATREQRLKNATWIGEFDDNRVTLVSCWPRDDNSHRIIAVGHFVGDGVPPSTQRQ
jgi:LPXTG-site transpeptidase (sortase) family protein